MRDVEWWIWEMWDGGYGMRNVEWWIWNDGYGIRDCGMVRCGMVDMG